MKTLCQVLVVATLVGLLLMGGRSGSASAQGHAVRGIDQTHGVVPSHVDQSVPAVEARIVAVGIPGAGAISPVGRFLPGGPIHDDATFAAYTEAGRVLAPDRILVGSRSNFGAPLADPSQSPGALLSIDPSGSEVLSVPASFASGDGQASALGGRVQLFSAQSPAFVNGLNTPGAVTAALAGVSNPHGLSLNNAFGRIWPANVASGLGMAATESILDPTGIPLASPPSPVVGGVYSGSLTNRSPQQLIAGGLSTGAIGTALLGRSPDGSGRAVFAIVCADGSIIQAHTEQGIDGLAPAGTITSLVDSVSSRVTGMPLADLSAGTLLNFEPVRTLFITDPLANTIVALDLLDDRRVFQPGAIRRISSPSFNVPVGLAAALPETQDSDWASNTTLFEDSDMFVANRGDNTIVRLRQDGTVLATVRLTVAGASSLGEAHLSGIAVSPNGDRLWVTVSGALPGFAGNDGAVLELPSFGPG